ncbi:MAG: 3'(2'),5'-bisphosphate nucleotidase CysQ family protein [Campylobacterales bacterium]
MKKNGEFTVNIALVKNQIPIAGVVYAPVLQECYYAKEGEGAYRDGVKLPLKKDGNYRVVASKSHRTPETDEFIDSLKLKHKDLEIVSKGSSLKLCMIASGEADIYPRLAPTMEWDTAAAHAVVSQSGKRVYEYGTKKELVYNKQDLLNPWFVVE